MLCVSPLRIASPGNLLENIKAKGGLSKQDYERNPKKCRRASENTAAAGRVARNGQSEFLQLSEARNASEFSIEILIQSLTTTATGFNKQVQCGLMLNADDTGPQQATGTRASPNGDNRGHAPHPVPLPMGEGIP